MNQKDTQTALQNVPEAFMFLDQYIIRKYYIISE